MKKKFLFITIITSLFCSFINVYASTNTYNREELENYGVRKKWNITETNKNNVLNTKAVDATEKIYDYSDVLTDEEENELKEQIDKFIEKYNVDLVIMIDNKEYPERFNDYCYSDSKADDEIFKFNNEIAGDFYDYNDFGINYENYDGILLFRNTAIDPCFNSMYYDMYTFGNVQLYFNQSRYDSVLDGIYDKLHSGNYYYGFVSFINKVSVYMDSGIPSSYNGYSIGENGQVLAPPRKYSIPWVGCIGFGLIIATIVVVILMAKNRMVKKAHKAEEYLDKESIDITNRQDTFLRSHTTSYTESSSSGGSGHSSGGGGFSHSGSSGGFHSSGGGRHG